MNCFLEPGSANAPTTPAHSASRGRRRLETAVTTERANRGTPKPELARLLEELTVERCRPVSSRHPGPQRVPPTTAFGELRDALFDPRRGDHV